MNATVSEIHVVTGATGYTGKYIAWQLIERGVRVRSLTGHLHRHDPFGGKVSFSPYNFENPSALVESLCGARVLYNTYWIRFPYADKTFDQAIQNTRVLLDAAKTAGIQRIVHISIANPSEDSPLPYYRGKALVEKAIVNSGLSYAILRPTVIFGPEDILINNIAWLLRMFPVFGIAGSGTYHIQPVFVEDMAKLAVEMAKENGNIVCDAVGPEIFSFHELVYAIRRAIGSKAKIIHISPRLLHLASKMISPWLKDVVLTRDEIEGLMVGLLVSNESPRGRTLLTDWLGRYADKIGARYASELDRHYRSERDR